MKIAWAFMPGRCTDVVAGPDNNMMNLEENSPMWCKIPKHGDIKPYERRAHYMGWVFRARKEFCIIFKARFGSGFKSAVPSLLLMHRKMITFISGMVNTITCVEMFCICQ